MGYILKSFECFTSYKKPYIFSKLIYILLNMLSMVDYYFLSKMITSLLSGNIVLFKRYLYIMVVWNAGLVIFRYTIDRYYARLIVNINNSIKKLIFESYFSFYQFSQSKDTSKLNNVFISEYITPMNFLDTIFNYISEVILLIYILAVLVSFDIRFLYTLALILPIVAVNVYFSEKIKFLKKQDYIFIDSIYGLVRTTTLFIYSIFSNRKIFLSINNDLDTKIKEKISVINNMNKEKLNLQYSIEIIVKSNMYIFYFIVLKLIVKGTMLVENFIFVSFYIQKVLYSMISLTKIIPQIQMYYVSLDRLFSVLGNNIEFKKSEKWKESINEIDSVELRGASFTINNKKILDNTNFVLKNTDKIIIRGKNGSGKSTLIKLISLQYPLTEGELFFNNELSHKYTVSSIFSNISVSNQNPCIIPLSLRDNISFDLEMKFNLDEMLVDFELVELVSRLPDGIDTIINKDIELSGGERKKIDLLRCMIKKADVYIFDEPLAYLDKEFKRKFSFLIKKYIGDKGFIIVEHNEISNINFDREFFVEEGRLFCVR